jgi:hypothetical protein
MLSEFLFLIKQRFMRYKGEIFIKYSKNYPIYYIVLYV